MPTSRRRKPADRSKRARATRRRERSRESRAQALEDRDVVAVRPGQSIEHLISAEDQAALEAEMAAGARGDAEGALEHHLAGLVVVESPTRHKLRELTVLADAAPGWMYARWCVDQAYRWMLIERDPRTEAAVIDTIASVAWREYQDLTDPTAMTEFGTRLAAGHWMCQQLAVYEYGGLSDFLGVRAEPSLIDRAGRVRDWVGTPMGGYVLEEVSDDRILVTDLSDGDQRDVLNIGALTDRRPGTPVIGRLVLTGHMDPILMFASRPPTVDRQTAHDVAQSGGSRSGWVQAVANAYDERRLPRDFGAGLGTLYSSDVVPDISHEDAGPAVGPPPPRLTELLAQGLGEHQANGVMVIELGLLVAGETEAAGAVAPHVATALVDPAIHSAVRRLCTAPEQARGWTALAAATTEPVRSRCLALAARCGGPRAA